MASFGERRPQVLHAQLDSRRGVAKLCIVTADNVGDCVGGEANSLRVPVLQRLLEPIALVERTLGVRGGSGAQRFAQRREGVKHSFVCDVCHAVERTMGAVQLDRAAAVDDTLALV